MRRIFIAFGISAVISVVATLVFDLSPIVAFLVGVSLGIIAQIIAITTEP